MTFLGFLGFGTTLAVLKLFTVHIQYVPRDRLSES